MTTRDLREILTEVDNQDITIRELRSILYERENQDEELTPSVIFEMTTV